MELHIVLAAIATSTALHGAMEPDNLMRKLRRLNTAMKTGKIEELPMKGIDTRPKAYGVGLLFMTVLAAVAYVVINAVDPSVDGGIQYSIAVLILGEFVLMGRLDQYHVEIEKMTKTQKK